MTGVTIITSIVSLTSRSLVIIFPTLLLLLSVAALLSSASLSIDKHTIFTILHQAWAFAPTNNTITQQSPNGTTNLTPSPVELAVYTDKPSYVVGETVVVSGSVGNVTQVQNNTTTTNQAGGPLSGIGGQIGELFGGGAAEGENVRIDIYNPAGGVFKSNLPAEISDTGLYSYGLDTSFLGDIPIGEYTATATYNEQVAEVKFTVVPKYSTLQSSSGKGITLDTDKPSYVVGETVVVSGSVGNVTQVQNNTTTTSTGGPLSGISEPLQNLFSGGSGSGGGGKAVRIDIYNPAGGVFKSNLPAEISDTGLYSYGLDTSFLGDIPIGEYTATATYNEQVAEVKFTVVSSLTG